MSEESEILAAEYVLGTLHADERTLFTSVLAHDREAREAVAAWERRLAPLSAAVPEIPPPPAIWERIECALPPLPRPIPAAIDGDLADAGAANAALRRMLNRWRGAALAAGALAAALAIFVADRELIRPSDESSYVAVVNRDGDLPALIVHVDIASGIVFVRPVAVEVPASQSLELWYIDQGKAPASMGLLAKNPMKLPLPAGALLEDAAFAVTIEPHGGSPTKAPTGPVVSSGKLMRE
jgi:anti-sigma-K factor RskA